MRIMLIRFFTNRERCIQIPPFPNDENRWVDAIERLPNLVHRFDVMESHQIEAEPVNHEFFRPVRDTLDHELTHHRTLGCRVIPTCRTIRECPVFI